jgi:hypothetical protein
MAEIYRDSVGTGVEFSMPTTAATVNSAKALRNGEEVVLSTAIAGGKTVTGIPYEVTRFDGKFDIEYTYTVSGQSYTKIESHEVVTPLFTPTALKSFDPDFNSVSDADIKNLEWLIRNLFYNLTGQRFGLENSTIAVYGTGGKALSLPKRSAEPVGPVFGDSTYPAIVTNDGWVVRGYQNESWIDKFEPSYSAAPQTFAQGQAYYLTGLWGYYSVPDDVSLAAMTLAQDYGCDQSIWRERYMKTVTISDMRFEFDGRAFIRTGNVNVDQILDRYARVRLVVL